MTDWGCWADDIDGAADRIIEELAGEPDAVMALPIPYGLSPRERANLIDHHQAVASEIRRRGHEVEALVQRLPQGEVLAIAMP